jgi:hypothetical protein
MKIVLHAGKTICGDSDDYLPVLDYLRLELGQSLAIFMDAATRASQAAG